MHWQWIFTWDQQTSRATSHRPKCYSYSASKQSHKFVNDSIISVHEEDLLTFHFILSIWVWRSCYLFRYLHRCSLRSNPRVDALTALYGFSYQVIFFPSKSLRTTDSLCNPIFRRKLRLWIHRLHYVVVILRLDYMSQPNFLRITTVCLYTKSPLWLCLERDCHQLCHLQRSAHLPQSFWSHRRSMACDHNWEEWPCPWTWGRLCYHLN